MMMSSCLFRETQVQLSQEARILYYLQLKRSLGDILRESNL